uniref:Photosystem II PsbY protein n=1 Tax=Eutreptiella gymnastica TaxID=73025 RepID=A0A6T2FRC9_9EUGL
MAVVCGLVGAASVAHFVAAPAATEMYAPVAVRPAVTSQAAVAPAASLAPLSAPIAAVAEQQQAEEVYEASAPAFEAQQPSTPWAPLVGLLSIPVGLVALALRRKAPARDADVEAGFAPTAAAAATLVAAQPALASQEVAQVAADNRLLALGGILVPALGWVAFNAASPAFRQLDEMGEKAAERDGKVRRGAPPPQKKTRGRR